jgi:hypothetical protein
MGHILPPCRHLVSGAAYPHAVGACLFAKARAYLLGYVPRNTSESQVALYLGPGRRFLCVPQSLPVCVDQTKGHKRSAHTCMRVQSRNALLLQLVALLWHRGTLFDVRLLLCCILPIAICMSAACAPPIMLPRHHPPSFYSITGSLGNEFATKHEKNGTWCTATGWISCN